MHPNVLVTGNLEVVNLLVKCKADAASKNKSGKLAADLARDPAVKEVLNKAMADVSKPQEHPVSSETGNAEPSGEQSTASLGVSHIHSIS